MKKTVSILLTAVLTICMFIGCDFSAEAVSVVRGTTGDVDDNGIVEVEDARMCLRYAIGLNVLAGFDQTAADTDGNGKIEVSDARVILRMAVGLEMIDPREQRIAGMSVVCPQALLYDVTERKILFAKNERERIAPASIMKLLTALTALSLAPPDMICTVGDEIGMIGRNSSVAYLQNGWRMPLRSVITGMLCSSGNDAAYTVAVNAARYAEDLSSDAKAVEFFVEQMNRKAAELGMTDSYFMNPDGYDVDGQYSTARDLLTLSSAAIQNEIIAGACDSRREYGYFADGDSVCWDSTNRLIDPDSSYYYPGACGLKTGSTADAGCCLSALYRYEKRIMIAIVAGCKDDEERYGTVSALFDAGK